MKATKGIIVVLIVLISVLEACTTAKSQYEKGNYYDAVMRSVEKLRKSPNNKSARETLANAYPQAINSFMDRLENEDQANVDFKFTKAVYTYEKLNKMYESIQRSPGAKQVITNPKKYYTTLNRIKPDAAEEQYSAGLYHLSLGDRNNAKKAYDYFVRADQFMPGYKDVGPKIDEAYNRSILHVVADLKPVQSRTYELSADIFYKQVENTLQQIENNEFIRFYTPEEASKYGLQNPDQILKVNFEDFVVGETHTRQKIEKMEKDSVVVGEVTLDSGRKKEVIGTVNADVSLYRMEVISRGLVNLSITQNGMDQRDLIYQDFPGEFVWFHEWGQFNGDERALTEEQSLICSNRRINPAPPQQLFVEFTKPIQQQMHNRLISFYKNY